MDLDFFKDNWGWISSNWWGSIGLILAGTIAGMTVIKLYYGRPRQTESESSSSSKRALLEEKFAYKEYGRHSKNILANSISDIEINESVSIRAEVPGSSRILVELRGPTPTYIGDGAPSWYIPMGKSINWTFGGYFPEKGGKQQFKAEGGIAELTLNFAREGEVQVLVYEGESRTPSWTKQLTVHPASA